MAKRVIAAVIVVMVTVVGVVLKVFGKKKIQEDRFD